MTAEIAILNREAVALAADSAVTLFDPFVQKQKIYDSAEKIFELSRSQPIGLMTYNYTEFMGIPLEVLIREYRKTIPKPFARLMQVRPNFFDFLKSNADTDYGQIYFRELLSQEMRLLNRKLMEHPSAWFHDHENILEDILKEACEVRKKQVADSPLENFLSDKTVADFEREYGGDVKTAAQKSIFPPFKTNLSENMIHILTDLVFSVVKSTERSSVHTGFVFAGFGEKDIFPTLDTVEFDGFYFGEPRLLNENSIDIDRRGETAAIIPFAQKDMPQRFVNGVDDEFQSQLRKDVEDLIVQTIKQGTNASPENIDEEKARAMLRFDKKLNELKAKYEGDLKSVVNFLSKKELAEVAYSLVELTSRKRRYSSDMETVGGPIDVAILTRNEGFIWVRRKHYFGAELNPGYFERLRFEKSQPLQSPKKAR